MSLGYQAFAIQNGGQCYGSSTAQLSYNRYGRSNQCYDGKGGPLANNVYGLKNGNEYNFIHNSSINRTRA